MKEKGDKMDNGSSGYINPIVQLCRYLIPSTQSWVYLSLFPRFIIRVGASIISGLIVGFSSTPLGKWSHWLRNALYSHYSHMTCKLSGMSNQEYKAFHGFPGGEQEAGHISLGGQF